MRRRSNAERIQEILSAHDEATKPAADVLAQLYQALLTLPEMRLADGTTAKVEAYYPPQTDDEDELHCGIDVRLSNGNLLEFTLKNTGWEKSFVHQVENRPAAENRQR